MAKETCRTTADGDGDGAGGEWESVRRHRVDMAGRDEAKLASKLGDTNEKSNKYSIERKAFNVTAKMEWDEDGVIRIRLYCDRVKSWSLIFQSSAPAVAIGYVYAA